MSSKICILVICSILAVAPCAYGTHTSCSHTGQGAAPDRGHCHCPKDGPCKCSDSPTGFFCCTLPESRGQGLVELQAWKCQLPVELAATAYTDYSPINFTIGVIQVALPEHYGGNDIFLQVRSFRS